MLRFTSPGSPCRRENLISDFSIRVNPCPSVASLHVEDLILGRKGRRSKAIAASGCDAASRRVSSWRWTQGG